MHRYIRYISEVDSYCGIVMQTLSNEQYSSYIFHSRCLNTDKAHLLLQPARKRMRTFSLKSSKVLIHDFSGSTMKSEL